MDSTLVPIFGVLDKKGLHSMFVRGRAMLNCAIQVLGLTARIYIPLVYGDEFLTRPFSNGLFGTQ